MRCEAELELEVSDPESLWRALEPDNLEAPPHLRVSCSPADRTLRCRVEVVGCEDPRRILTLRNTLDEILVLARAVEDSFRALGEGSVLKR
ncbi:MAG: hypothetical protein F7C34_00910 [Desulfurococcales archaeon]|nr:hypothetical protein [Desulfurococcales archaeon]